MLGIFFVVCLGELLATVLSATLPNQNNPGISRQSKYVVSNIPKLEGDLASQQVETIRQIIEAEQKNRQTYAQAKEISNLSASKDTLTEKTSTFEKNPLDNIPTLQELKEQCQYFSKLFSVKYVEQNESTSTSESETPTGGTLRPVYIRNKPTFIQKKNGFFVTVQPIGMKRLTDKHFTTTRRSLQRSTTTATSTTISTSTTTDISTTETPQNTPTTNVSTTTAAASPNESIVNTPPPKVKVKYTRLEPVILQKTILTDGRVLYHWHKALPTSLFDMPVAETPIVQPLAPMMDLPSYTPPAFKKPQPETTTDLTTTTTTEESSWLFVPFRNFFSGGYSEEESTTMSQKYKEANSTTSSTATSSTTTQPTTASTTTTSTSASTTTTEIPKEEIKFQEQLKFVVPVQYGDMDQHIAQQRKPWDYHRFAYYPKELQPINAIGNPPLPVIKSVVVPKFNLAYASGAYGLSYPNMEYGAGYGNYQRISR